MKKLIFAALAIAAMAACTKSNVQFDQPGEIAFQPVAQKATKATFAGTAYPQDSTFNVWAWWGDKNAGATDASSFNTIYINNQTFERRDYVNWGGSEKPYYWPTTGSLFFAGYSPASIATQAGFGYSHGEQKFVVTGYKQSNDIAKTTDLMWFHLTDVSYDRTTESVPVKFHHALSWLTFRFSLKDNFTPQDWTVNSVKLIGIKTKGNFEAERTGSADLQGTAKWTEQSEPKEVQVYNNDAGHKVTLVTTNYSPLVEDASVLENTRNGVVVIPQPCQSALLEIKFQQVAPSGTIVSQTKTLDLGTEWLPGKHYIYTITFGAEEILIAPEVVDWEEVKDLAVPVK